MSGHDLTESEKAAKNFYLDFLIKGYKTSEPCDDNFTDEIFKPPKWFDEAKFKRGQKYFKDNRAGIMMSNFYGLLTLICEPHGTRLLDRTQQSSTAETAKKRYISTTLHMLSWYEEELKPGTKSWESLKRVRKMHLCASRATAKDSKGFQFIPQSAMSATLFGFMGFTLVKPHQLGIRHDNDEDREAFVHFWAVIGSMLGIKDEFNMCLFPLDVVEIICHIHARYFYLPLLQLQTPLFEKMARAIVDGLYAYSLFPTFESRMFLCKRLIGVPGYQYKLDASKEFFIRQIFTAEELKMIKENFQNKPGYEYRRNFLVDEKIRILDIKRKKNQPEIYQKVPEEKMDNEPNSLMNIFELKHESELSFTDLDDTNYKKHLNDAKFHELSFKEKFLIKFNLDFTKRYGNNFFRPLHEAGVSAMLFIMKKNAKFSYENSSKKIK